MKLFMKFFIFCGLIALSIQGIATKSNCDCSKRNQHRPSNHGFALVSVPASVGKHITEMSDSKCNICEKRKEMLRLERERQKQMQKCPFEILATPMLTGKTSEEVFDELRNLIVPSQNGFFDLMRGIVKTMHVSSESELLWAKAKEAKMMAKKQTSQRNQERK